MRKEAILSLSGNPNSGKSSIATHLAAKYGFTIFRPSGLIKEYAAARALPLIERRDYINAHIQMIDEYGERYVIDTITAMPGTRLCVDGERIPAHIEGLRELGAKVMAFWCPQELRFERSLLRGELRDKPSRHAFAQDEAREYCSNERPYTSVMTIMQIADYHIDASQPPSIVIQTVVQHVDRLLGLA
ncbi:MAG TPA: hypothetical protein VFN56_03475 [Candidatus Saccharimonadales bacterium]|nr:hypothetical protein [Candidatus Saccharimonadales bacterium]